MEKYIVLAGRNTSETNEEFQERHFSQQVPAISGSVDVERYIVNITRRPSDELVSAGWGWGGEDESGIAAIDEIYCSCQNALDIEKLYAHENVIGAYRVNEHVMKNCVFDASFRGKTFWLKRIGLLKHFDGQRDEDFFAYWLHIHGPKALEHHIGTGQYIQNHITQKIKTSDIDWKGIVELSYWNMEAFKYGHFSKPGSKEAIMEDGSHFMDKFLAILADEYIMK